MLDRPADLLRQGRILLAQRLRAAQDESRTNAHAALVQVGRAIGRGDKAGALANMALAIAHYSAAGEVALAHHWRMRRAAL